MWFVTFQQTYALPIGLRLHTSISQGVLRNISLLLPIPRTVPRNHELRTPGQVRPLSRTLIPSPNTVVLAATAGPSPGLGDRRQSPPRQRTSDDKGSNAGDRAGRDIIIRDVFSSRGHVHLEMAGREVWYARGKDVDGARVDTA